jgi:ribosomal protein L40E
MCYATKGEGNSGVGLLPLEDLDASRLSKLFSMSDSREASSALAFELSQHRTEATMLCKRCVAKLSTAKESCRKEISVWRAKQTAVLFACSTAELHRFG